MNLPSRTDESPQRTTGSRGAFWTLVLANAVLCAVLARWVFSAIDADEIEHAHVAWAMNQGLMPYRDLHQNHLPTLWIAAAPIANRLPESADSLIALRGLSLLALASIYAVGLLALRDVLGSLNRWQTMALLLTLLGMTPDCELYRFRPDPWMALFSALAVWFAIRLGRGPGRYAFLCGVSLGVAASFSPKMAPLCLLIPVVCVEECLRQRSLRPFWPIVPNAAGFIAGVAPIVAWIVSAGLWDSFHHWCLSDNSRELSLDWPVMGYTLLSTGRLAVLPVVGMALLFRTKPIDAAQAWPPRRVLAAAFALAWSIVVLEPNHALYNLQAALMPSAVLGAIALWKLDEIQANAAAMGSRPWFLRFAAFLGIAVVLVADRPLWGCFQPPPGHTIARDELQRLVDLTRSDGATCVTITPWHPVFCRDATDLYLVWDFLRVQSPWEPDAEKQKYAAMWRQAVAEIESKRPTLVLGGRDGSIWSDACREGLISPDEKDRLMRCLHAHYRAVSIEGANRWTVFVRNEETKQP